MSTPVFDSGIWRGTTSAYGAMYMAELFPSAQSPEYYHCSFVCVSENPAHEAFADTTKRPVTAEGAQNMIAFLLKREGLTIADLVWEKLANKSQLKIEHPELIRNPDKPNTPPTQEADE